MKTTKIKINKKYEEAKRRLRQKKIKENKKQNENNEKHSIKQCKECYQNLPNQKGCAAFLDKSDPILNQEKKCQGRIIIKAKYNQLLINLRGNIGP